MPTIEAANLFGRLKAVFERNSSRCPTKDRRLHQGTAIHRARCQCCRKEANEIERSIRTMYRPQNQVSSIDYFLAEIVHGIIK